MENFFLPPHVVNEYGPVLPQSQTIDWGMNVLNVPSLHTMGLTGKGVTVAVIDTGIDSEHPDLKGGVTKVLNTTAEPFSAKHGHGIGAAGIIGARNNNTGVLGVAPECDIVGIKAMRETGGGNMNEIVNGIEQAIRLKVDVINLSLGTTANDPMLRAVIKKAVDEGIYVVCSAGNSGRDNSVVYPARYAEVYAVGATNQSGHVSAFSSRGWEVDIAAPGERVLTTWKNKTYAKVSGTSFSAPYVSGLFALFIQSGCMISHDMLKQTAIDIEEPGQDTKSGHGLIDPVSFIDECERQDEESTPPSDDQVVEDPLSDIRAAHALLTNFLTKANK